MDGAGEKKQKHIIAAVYNTDFFPAKSLTLSYEDSYIFVLGLVVLV